MIKNHTLQGEHFIHLSKFILVVIIIAFGNYSISSQESCLADGLRLSTQAQVNAFPANYPGCTQVLGRLEITAPGISSLDSLRQLEILGGGIQIASTSVTDLRGLTNLRSCTGDLLISGNEKLRDISALKDMVLAGPNVTILDNESLESLRGLEGVQRIDQRLFLSGNAKIIDLAGLDNLEEVQQEILIQDNASLLSLQGMGKIAGASGQLIVFGNEKLKEISALNQLRSVSSILLNNCPELSDISGIKNIEEIAGNVILLNIGVENLTDLPTLQSVKGQFSVERNSKLTSLQGLESLVEVGGFSLEGNPLLEDVDPLNALKTIGGDLRVTTHERLQNLAGLSSLEAINGYLFIYQNTALSALTGVDNLARVGSFLWIWDNGQLENLSGLQGVTEIGGSLTIESNANLTSLEGIDNIDPLTIGQLNLINNPKLQYCNTTNICNYLSDGENPANVTNNDEGCASVEQIEDACATTSVLTMNFGGTISIYPQPVKDIVTVEVQMTDSFATGAFFSAAGQLIRTKIFMPGLTSIDLSDLSPGLYLLQINGSKGMDTHKIIKL